MSLDIDLKIKIPACECCGKEEKIETVFSANITHNLGKMAKEAGIYYHLWRPEELKITKAEEIIEPLMKSLEDMQKRPTYYQQFDSPNGWGVYSDFIPWIDKYLHACIEYPKATIWVSR